MKRIISTKKRATIFSVLMMIVVLLLFIECNVIFPKDITIFEGENLLVGSSSPYTISTPASFGGVLEESGNLSKDNFSTTEKYITANDTGSYSASVKLFGVIPVKNVNINVSETKMLIPGGNTIGIKMFTEGLLCVGTSDIADKKGVISNLAVQNDIKPGTFYNWVKRLRQKGCTEIPDALKGHITHRQEIVKIELTSPATRETAIATIPEKNNLPIQNGIMEISIAGTVLRIPNGTDPVLLGQTIHILKELSC